MSPSPNKGFFRKVLFFLKLLEIRLRFVVILVVTALIVGYWDNVQNYYERWQRERMAAKGELAGAKGQGLGAAQGEFEYYCPMHTFVVRGHAGKCPICGMDLVERKKGAPTELPEGVLTRVQASPERIMQAGVEIEPVLYRLLTRTVRSYGLIEADETRQARIIARFPGRVDQLFVNAVGMVVRKGDPLASIYSPKFLSAAEEYTQAVRAQRRIEADRQSSAEEKRRAEQLTGYARQRLVLAGFTQDQLDALAKTGQAEETVTLYSPLAGTVMEKNVLLGQMVEEGTALYNVTDLSSVWAQALIAESDLSAIRLGMAVEVATVAWSGEIFYGTVDFIYPTVNPDNRSCKVRIIIDNREGHLKPGMYVSAVMRSPMGSFEEIGPGAGPAQTAKSAPLTSPSSPSSPSTPTTTIKGAIAKPSTKLPTETPEAAQQYLSSLAPGATYYTCPMHAEVVSDKPGDCPKCGMHLEAKTLGELGGGGPTSGTQAVPGAGGAHHPIGLPTRILDDAQRYLASLVPEAAYYTCTMDPEVVSDKPGSCPKCGMPLVERTLTAQSRAQGGEPDAGGGLPSGPGESLASAASLSSLQLHGWRERWAEGYACPMHLGELSDKPGICPIDHCGMQMKHWRIERVLSVPESAVIDTGTRRIVYVESMPGVYDAHAVELGPRAGVFYPVLRGLNLDEHIVTRGSFLIDAEARLNPVAATAPTAGAEHPHGG